MKSRLDSETAGEIAAYAFGMHLQPVYYSFDTIPAAAKQDIAAYLREKIRSEGPPIAALVDEIGADGVIERPVILDVENQITVEGRHRLAAALKYGLDVPVVLIRSTPGRCAPGRGWRKL